MSTPGLITGNDVSRARFSFFPAFALFHQRWAAVFIPVGHLAFQAVMAFVIDDFPGRLDGRNLALCRACLTGLAALLAAAQPVKDAKTGKKNPC